MKNILTVSALVCFNIILLFGVLSITTPSFSNNWVQKVDDEEIYSKIDSIVAEVSPGGMDIEIIPETHATVRTITADSPFACAHLKKVLERSSKGGGRRKPAVQGDFGHSFFGVK